MNCSQHLPVLTTGLHAHGRYLFMLVTFQNYPKPQKTQHFIGGQHLHDDPTEVALVQVELHPV